MTADRRIAVIGMACRFPAAPDVDAFWSLLREGHDAIRSVPPERWQLAAPGTQHAGLIDAIDQFDEAFFQIAPREAAGIDPQQRLLLEVAWEALESAGIPRTVFAGSKTGVFVGISTSDYSRIQDERASRIDAWSGTGNAFSIAANRIAYALDLRGPSIAVDTACSSSLVALHLARRSLLTGESDLALAGGVNALLSVSSRSRSRRRTCWHSTGAAKRSTQAPTGTCAAKVAVSSSCGASRMRCATEIRSSPCCTAPP
jgi:acyl transferase domain-containing protein